MGYMGFGMQKWIYSQKPRKPFSKERTPGYDTLPGHSNDEFSDGGLPSQNMESIDERISEGKFRIKSHWIRNRIGDFIIASVIIVIIILVIIRFVSQTGIWSSEDLSARQKAESETRRAYELSMEYGIGHFEKGEHDEAIVEFKNALRLYPQDNVALDALAATYYKLCLTENRYCNEAILSYNQLINKGNQKNYIQAKNVIKNHIKNRKTDK